MSFKLFDHPFLIERLALTRGYRDQVTGSWVDEIEAATPIEGNFDRGITDEDQSGVSGIENEGDSRLYTESTLRKEERVRVHFDGSGTNFLTFRVTGMVQDYSWLEQFVTPAGRREYSLELERGPV